MNLITDVVDLVSSEEEEEVGWPCSQCTFINSPVANKCEVCGRKKEKARKAERKKREKPEKPEKKENKKAKEEEALYTSVASRGRDYWFERVKSAQGSLVWPVLAAPGSASMGARGSKPRVNLQVMDSGAVKLTSRMATAPVTEAMQAAIQHGRRFLWLPIQLNSSSAKHHSEQHANAMFFDLESKEVWVFEPHGGDVDDARQGHFQHFYQRASYEEAMHTMLDPLGLTIHLPSAYMPPVFGQAITGDRWCVLWTLLFFDGATRVGPARFIAQWQNASLQQIQEALLTASQWMISDYFLS